VIPHAGDSLAPSPAAGTLSIPVVKPAFGALAMAATGTAQALGAGLGGAAHAAVDMAAIAAPADGEDGLAARASRQS
jgi:hypothetical protein